MNRQRELALQKLSNLHNLESRKNFVTEEMFKGKPMGAMSIEAAMGMYMCVLDNKHVKIASHGVFIVKDRKCEKEESPETGYNENCLKDETDSDMVFARLDSQRSAGFLLYSYNKSGMHSTLGENQNVYSV